MSAAENVRSFWAAKARSDSPTTNLRTTREGPTMEGLRSTLQRTKSWDQARMTAKTTPAKTIDLPANIVSSSPFKEQDRSNSPRTSPLLTQSRQLPKIMTSDIHDDPEIVSRPDSPYKSALASPDVGKYGALSRNKSVTFNDSLEVRHMSDRSFDTGSSPFSMRYDNEDEPEIEEDEDEESDMSVDDIVHENTWSNTTPGTKALPTLDDPFDAPQPRGLPSIPTLTAGPRPLPVVPVQRASSPSQKLMATEQENSRKTYPGLGLHLANNSELDLRTVQDTRQTSWNADEAEIRHEALQTAQDDDDPEADSADEASVSTAVLHDVGEKSRSSTDHYGVTPNMSSPVLRTYSPARSPEPISRELVKERMAQRKAAKANTTHVKQDLEAFRPNHSLAPPLPHFDSFVKMTPKDATDVLQVSDTTQSPDSATSEAEFPSRIVPQRKVSDTHRPATPVDQIQETSPQPQSGRAVHHDREKRLSSDLFLQKPPPSPKSAFTAVNYDGDDYDDDYNEDHDVEPEDDLVIHPLPIPRSHDVIAAEVKAEQVVVEQPADGIDKSTIRQQENAVGQDEEEVLRHLPQIPNVPRNTSEQQQIKTPTTPSSPTFDMRHMSLSLDLVGFGTDSLGLEDYMTPERRPETPITSRTVNEHSPTKTSSNDSALDMWSESNPTSGAYKDTPETATITARGMKLRTRPSMTPADAAELAARRRKVSSEIQDDASAVFGRVRSESVTGSTLSGSVSVAFQGQQGQIETPDEELDEDPIEKIQAKAMPVLQPLTRELSFSDINNAFDRVMQKQKKGYVIRQQSRVVHASANHVEPEPDVSSPRSDVQSDTASRGHTRQSSSVYTDISNYSAISKTNENFSSHRRQGSRIPVGVQMSPNPQQTLSGQIISPKLSEKLDGGRLFVKVMQVRQLTLPIPKGEDSYFCCTLDNGKHCVTTPWHNLANSVKINQEFELIADHDLEFILTLQAQYVPPVVQARPKSTLGRLLNSPKRHKPSGSITTLSLAGYVGNDGSFARAHMALKHFRSKAFGRPYSLIVPMLNEWAVEPTGIAIKGVQQTRQRKPYKIGEIELQLLYVPPVAGEHYQSLPTSLSQAVRDIRDAEWHTKQHCEGYLSQQGGDCPYWRRRHFKLVGSKLTAYHANTGHIRATINLSKATKVLDDKESLTAPEVTIGRGDNKKRRKSGFAAHEEGHLYVAEGFRIRFANGEVIDFYADSRVEKEKWTKTLENLVGKVPVIKNWCKLVLQTESVPIGVSTK